MKIVFIISVFPPEPEPAGIMADELTRDWCAAGHRVEVICPVPNRPAADRAYPGFLRRLRQTQQEGARKVTRVWSWLLGKRRRSWDRILENATFGLTAAWALLLATRPDVVVVESWPVLSYLPIVLVCRWRRVPFLNYVQDVYPEAAISGGQVRAGSPTARWLTTLDRWICQQACVNLVVGRSMQSLLVERRGLARERFHIVENWLDLAAIRPVDAPRWRSEVGLGAGDFVCLYAGTMGHASGVGILAEVAEALRDDQGVRLVCIGEGVQRPVLEEEVRRRRLDNLMLLPFQPRERVAEVQSSADVLLLTTAVGVGASSVPSKLITYLAVGRPVVCAAALDSDVAGLVREAAVGSVVAPGDVPALVQAIREARARPDAERRAMGERARQLALGRFSREAAMRHFDALFVSLGFSSEKLAARQ